MSTKITKILASGVIIATAGIFASASLAAPTGVPSELSKATCQHHHRHHHRFHHRGRMMRLIVVPQHSLARSWRRALHVSKHFTTEQARTITESAILLYGNPNMQVGTIVPVKLRRGRHGYRIQILGKNGKLVKVVVMNAANGRVHSKRIKK